jgi:photosystem II stability/assembly factor-like uncharacterized protein
MPTTRRVVAPPVCLLLLLALMSCSSGSSSTAPDNTPDPVRWTWQSALPQGDEIRDIHMFSATHWLVTTFGGRLITTDAGDTWDYVAVPAATRYGDVAFVDANNGFMASEWMGTFRTSDGGVTWNAIDVGGAVRWTSVNAPSAMTIILTSGGFGTRRSLDGGATWTNYANAFNQVDACFLDDNTGVAVSDKIYRTTDGGETWTQRVSLSTGGLNAVHAAGNRVWAVGTTGDVRMSDDAGFLWNQQDGGFSTLYGVYAIDANTAVAVGNAVIMRTTDGGTNWTQVVQNFDELYRTVTFVDAQNGVVGGIGGVILRTTDGGLTWTRKSSHATTMNLLDVDMVTADIAYAVGDAGTILNTVDGGVTWQPQTSGTTTRLWVVDAIDALTVTTAGLNGEILRTNDGGASWVPQTSGTSESLFGVSFVDADTGWVVGNASTIRHTTDAGATWLFQGSPVPGKTIWDVFAVTAAIAYACGSDGLLLKTVNGGTWTALASPVTDHIFTMDFLDADNGMVGTRGGDVMWTSDGGQTWDVTPSPGFDTPASVVMISPTTAWSLRTDVLYTTDRGATWIETPTGLATRADGISFGDANTATIVGKAGAILRTTNAAR